MEGDFWLKRVGYDEDCELLPMREVFFARIANLSRAVKEKGKKNNIKRLNMLLERYINPSNKKNRK